jgi:hypothetical protein
MEKVHGSMYDCSQKPGSPQPTPQIVNLATSNNLTDIFSEQMPTLPSSQDAGISAAAAAVDAEIKELKEIIKLREKELASIGLQNEKLRTAVSRYRDRRKRSWKWRGYLR